MPINSSHPWCDPLEDCKHKRETQERRRVLAAARETSERIFRQSGLAIDPRLIAMAGPGFSWPGVTAN